MASATAKAGFVELDIDGPEQEQGREHEREQTCLRDALGSQARGERGARHRRDEIVTDIGKRRLPVSNAARPSTTCR
jgi:hypothetical protein